MTACTTLYIDTATAECCYFYCYFSTATMCNTCQLCDHTTLHCVHHKTAYTALCIATTTAVPHCCYCAVYHYCYFSVMPLLLLCTATDIAEYWYWCRRVLLLLLQCNYIATEVYSYWYFSVLLLRFPWIDTATTVYWNRHFRVKILILQSIVT
jgi:hypothetical protein